MFGLALWIAAGLTAFGLAWLVRFGRSGSRLMELPVAIAAAFLAGLAATALDFGGWAEPDLRAGLFAFLTATTTLALIRLLRLVRNKLGQPGSQT